VSFLLSGTSKNCTKKQRFAHGPEIMMGRVFVEADLDGANQFNAKELLGKSCMIKVNHEQKNGKTYSKIANLIQTPEGIPELEPGEFDEEVFASLSSWTKEKIQGSEGFSNLRYAAQGTQAIGTGKDGGRIDR
jgi:hypothetical protein